VAVVDEDYILGGHYGVMTSGHCEGVLREMRGLRSQERGRNTVFPKSGRSEPAAGGKTFGYLLGE